MGQPVSSELITDSDLEDELIREGWSLHDRLDAARSIDDDCSISDDEILLPWQRVVAPDTIGNFQKRLIWDGLTSTQAAWALNPPPERIPPNPDWLPLLRSLRQAGRAAAGQPAPAGPLEMRGSMLPFVHSWRPVAAWALSELQLRCRRLAPRLSLSETAWLDLAEALLERLCSTAEHALWELFRSLRTPGQILLAHLGEAGDGQGPPVHEAYDQLIDELLRQGYAPLLQQAPVLGRLLALVVQLWLDSSASMLERIAATRDELRLHFAIDPGTVLDGISLGLSDPHRGGLSVAILHFQRAEAGQKLVYKPKDMRVDSAYQNLLTRLNEASCLSPLRCLKILDKQGFGFMEWVEHRLCTDDIELESFYNNAGRLTAILYLLGCTDCHHENLIACHEHLLLIDTETLLEAEPIDVLPDSEESASQIQQSLQGSVLRTGLLPHWVSIGARRRQMVDMSALGIQPPPAERHVQGWLGLNSDGMMAGRSLQPAELPTSLPVGLGQRPRLNDFTDALCAGFEQQLHEAMRLRPLLLETLETFAGLPRRLVPRATRLYSALQRQMLEPAALRSAVSHGLRLEQLSRSYVLAHKKPKNWAMFAAERLQMARLDIPFFEHRIDGEELPLPDGLPTIEGYLQRSGLDSARRRIRELDLADIRFQIQLMRGAITARSLTSPAGRPARDSGSTDAPSSPDGGTGSLPPGSSREEALRLAQAIWDSSICDRRGRPDWLGMDLGTDGESFRFGLVGISLYAGKCGIAMAFARLSLSLAALGRMEEASLWRHRAWACLVMVAEQAERGDDRLFRLVRDLPYGLNGSGGLLLSLHLLGQAGFDAAAPLAEQLLKQIREERLAVDEGLDLIAGVTGLIGPLLLLGSPRSLELAMICGERLLTTQLDNGGWPTRQVPLTGFSHGAAGMAAALGRLAQRTGDRRFADAAERALDYERGVFVPAQGNWPDFRRTTEPEKFMCTWCHGAPGILLSRLILQDAGWNSATLQQERALAEAATIQELQRGSSLSSPIAHLCCGMLGLSSVLRLSGGDSGHAPLETARRSDAQLVRSARRHGHYNLFALDTGSINLPGLFTGLAGVALTLEEGESGVRWLPALLSAGLLKERQGPGPAHQEQESAGRGAGGTAKAESHGSPAPTAAEPGADRPAPGPDAA